MGKVIGEETGGMNVCYEDILRYALPVSKLNADSLLNDFGNYGQMKTIYTEHCLTLLFLLRMLLR